MSNTQEAKDLIIAQTIVKILYRGKKLRITTDKMEWEELYNNHFLPAFQLNYQKVRDRLNRMISSGGVVGMYTRDRRIRPMDIESRVDTREFVFKGIVCSLIEVVNTDFKENFKEKVITPLEEIGVKLSPTEKEKIMIEMGSKLGSFLAISRYGLASPFAVGMLWLYKAMATGVKEMTCSFAEEIKKINPNLSVLRDYFNKDLVTLLRNNLEDLNEIIKIARDSPWREWDDSLFNIPKYQEFLKELATYF